MRGLTWPMVVRYRFVVALALVSLALPLLQLVPLPPPMWQALPGRAIIVDIDRLVGLDPLWRPLSLVPAATWNAVYAMFLPLAVLLLGLKLSDAERALLLPVILVLGLASATLGIFQLLGPNDSLLYFYTQTHNGSAVGFFANRNHQAAFLACLFPAIGLWVTMQPRARLQRARLIGGGVAALMLVPLLLITGSRAGLVAGVLGMIAGLAQSFSRLSAGARGRGRGLMLVYAALAFLVIGLGALSVSVDRGEAFKRLAAWNPQRDLRLDAWTTVETMVWHYFPAGIGMGSFPDVYKIDEPDHLLTGVYFNHAHNDWLEMLLTGGLPGAILMALIGLGLVWKAAGLFGTIGNDSHRVGLAWLGLFMLVILAFSSITDYPLRVPAMMCIAMVALVWLASWSRQAPVV
ncbi:MAG: O-antigen ligase family protein [Sphingomonas sp.]